MQSAAQSTDRAERVNRRQLIGLRRNALDPWDQYGDTIAQHEDAPSVHRGHELTRGIPRARHKRDEVRGLLDPGECIVRLKHLEQPSLTVTGHERVGCASPMEWLDVSV